MRVKILTILICLLLSTVAPAQPPVDETWLVVVPTMPGGAALPAKACGKLVKVDGEARVATLVPPSFAMDGRIVFSGIAPGAYEVTIYFPTLGLVDAPHKVDVQLGYNTVTWALPAITQVRLLLTSSDKPVLVTDAQCFCVAVAGGGVMAPPLAPVDNSPVAGPAPSENPPAGPSPSELAKYGQQCMLFPGKYRVALLTEKGYAITELDTAAAKEGTLALTLPLLPGGVVPITVTNTKERPLYGTLVTFTREIAKDLPVTLSFTTQENTELRTPALPPGDWEWSARRKGYRAQSETLAVTAGDNDPLEIELLLAR